MCCQYFDSVSVYDLTNQLFIGIWLMQIPTNIEVDNRFAMDQQLYFDDCAMSL
jgi:hypothetical protein